VPAEERLGPHQEEGLTPGADPADEQHQERAVGRRHARALRAAAQDDDLVAEERILGEQLRATPQQVRAHPSAVRRRWSRPDAVAEGVPYTRADRGQALAASSQKHHQAIPLTLPAIL